MSKLLKNSSWIAGLLILFPMAFGRPVPAQSGKSHVMASKWRPEVEKIDEALRKHRFKAGLKQARRLAETVKSRSWHGPDLQQIMADLAFYQAVASANLGSEREAIWYWHIAWNLDFKTSKRDLAPYGDAGKILREFPLRDQDEVPAGFVVPRGPHYGVRVEPPEGPRLRANPRILNNTGATIDGSGDCHVEIVVDENGVLHQPVNLSPHRHPIVIYAVLQWMLEKLPAFEPLRIDGEAHDSLFDLTIRFHVERW